MDNNTVIKFLDVLGSKGIRAVLWKNLSEIDDGLCGKKDLDILIPEVDWRSARCVLIEYGFVEAENFVASFPNVYHYYGLLDGIIVHFNIYTRIMTGESQTKSFDIPLVESILNSSGFYYHQQILTPGPNVSLYIYLIRYFIKVSSIPSYIRYLFDKEGYQKEYDLILSRAIDYEDNEFCLCGIDNRSLLDAFNNKTPIAKLFYALKIRFMFNVYSRYSSLEIIRIRYTQILKRIANKVILKKKKSLSHQGAIIALTGLDGAGKSSSVEMLSQWFSKHFDCVNLHLGRPKPVLITLPIRFGLAFKSILKSKNKITNTNEANIKESTLIEAIRYIALAIERLAVMKKALRLRAKGTIVILDRYPSLSLGKMDGRRVVSLENTGLIKKMAEVESWIYRSMPVADLLLKLEIPVEVALERNRSRIKKGKETDNEIIFRHKFNQNLEYNAVTIAHVDMNRSIDETMNDIKKYSWLVLN